MSDSGREAPESLRIAIATPCPSCGLVGLYVGTGGHLRCSAPGCHEPDVTASLRLLLSELDASHVTTPTTAHDGCPGCRDGECPLHIGTPSHLGDQTTPTTAQDERAARIAAIAADMERIASDQTTPGDRIALQYWQSRLRGFARSLRSALASPADALSQEECRLAATSLEAEGIRFPGSLHAGRCAAVAAKLRRLRPVVPGERNEQQNDEARVGNLTPSQQPCDRRDERS